MKKKKKEEEEGVGGRQGVGGGGAVGYFVSPETQRTDHTMRVSCTASQVQNQLRCRGLGTSRWGVGGGGGVSSVCVGVRAGGKKNPSS